MNRRFIINAICGFSIVAGSLLTIQLSADQFDADVCNSMRDKDERKGCIIRVMGYSAEVCNMHPSQSKEHLLCLGDVERFEAIDDPCRKSLQCYGDSEMDKARKQMSIILTKPGSEYISLGDVNKVPKMTALYWINPGKGEMAYSVGNLGILKWGPKGASEYLRKRRLK